MWPRLHRASHRHHLACAAPHDPFSWYGDATATGVALAVVGVVALPASAAGHHGRPHHQTVYLSDVQYDSPGRDDRSNRSLNGEWVEVTNDSR